MLILYIYIDTHVHIMDCWLVINKSFIIIQVRKEKLGDRIAALQQLVAPFGKVLYISIRSFSFIWVLIISYMLIFMHEYCVLQVFHYHTRKESMVSLFRNINRTRDLRSVVYMLHHELNEILWNSSYNIISINMYVYVYVCLYLRMLVDVADRHSIGTYGGHWVHQISSKPSRGTYLNYSFV